MCLREAWWIFRRDLKGPLRTSKMFPCACLGACARACPFRRSSRSLQDHPQNTQEQPRNIKEPPQGAPKTPKSTHGTPKEPSRSHQEFQAPKDALTLGTCHALTFGTCHALTFGTCHALTFRRALCPRRVRSSTLALFCNFKMCIPCPCKAGPADCALRD